jgi:hypothetical protein
MDGCFVVGLHTGAYLACIASTIGEDMCMSCVVMLNRIRHKVSHQHETILLCGMT